MSDRVIFTEESIHGRWVKISTGSMLDETLLDAIAGFVERARKRLIAASDTSGPESPDAA